jgi:error-prone DNA polymerase
VRLGLRLVSGLKEAAVQRLVRARAGQPFTSADDLARRADLAKHEMDLLAAADALGALAGHRRQQVWEAAALQAPPELLREAPIDEDELELQEAPEGEAVVWDYRVTGLTLRSHPVKLIRRQLWKRGYMSAQQLRDLGDGVRVRACGIVTLRQQPETAKGTIFVSLEDETGEVQVICWRAIKEQQRAELIGARLLGVQGVWQREGDVRNLIAHRLEDLTPLLGELATSSRDFH